MEKAKHLFFRGFVANRKPIVTCASHGKAVVIYVLNVCYIIYIYIYKCYTSDGLITLKTI